MSGGDYTVASSPAKDSLVQKKSEDPASGKIFEICNGLNSGKCVEADIFSVKAIRRPGKAPLASKAEEGKDGAEGTKTEEKANPNAYANWDGLDYTVKATKKDAPAEAPADGEKTE